MRAHAGIATSSLALGAMIALVGSMYLVVPQNTVLAAGSLNTSITSTDATPPSGPAANQIDTSSKEAVREAYLSRYAKNLVRVQQNEGADLDKCEAGKQIAAGITPAVESWNFLRGLSGLDAVVAKQDTPLSKYVVAAALTSAANAKLSHYPDRDGFKCASPEAVRGARHSNLAQSTSQTVAEQMLWYYMDYSLPTNPSNDQLGHRLFMMDPELSLTAVAAVEGYTAVSVRTGESYPEIPAEEMRSLGATIPSWMSWPSQGFFPKQLLTSVGQTTAGADPERWSFSVRGADLSQATATISDPNGNLVPITVIRPGQIGVANTPRDIAGYSTILMKFDPFTKLPEGQENQVYTVEVSGVKGAAQSQYRYQVVLFDPTTPLTQASPQVSLAQAPMTGVGYRMTQPIKMNLTAWPQASVTWQEQIAGGEWKNIAGATSTEYLPEGAWDLQRGRDTRYRMVATSALGTATSEPVAVQVQGLETMPGAKSAKPGEDVTWTAKALIDQDGTRFDTNYEWQKLVNGKWETLEESDHFTGTRTASLTVHNVGPADDALTVRQVVRSKLYRLSGFDVIMVWSDGRATLNVIS